MKRAVLFFMIAAVGIFCFDIAPAWGRGFGESRGGGGAARGGGGFSHVPSPSRAGGGFRAESHFAPHPSYQAAPMYQPGPTARYEPHVESYHPAYTARPNIERGAFVDRRAAVERRAAVDRQMEGVRRPALERNFELNTAANRVVNNHWDRWHGHSWDGGWYHGNWHGNWDNYWHAGWSDWWDNPWYARTAFWGVTGWWLGASVYDWGYLPYYNPYYTQSLVLGPTVIDYEQPVQTVDYGEASEGENLSPVSTEATGHADAARKAFYDGDYPLALREIERALSVMSGDPAFHELRALILFAMGHYRPAAAAIHSLLAVGPGWDWTTMIGLYPSEDVYTKQLRALEIYRQDHPNDAAARFLLAYHYLTMGHTAAAAVELRATVHLVPRDRVAAQLLSMITSAPNQEGQAALSPPPAPEEPNPAAEAAPAAIDPNALVGSWTARRDETSFIQLSLTPDSRFLWRFGQGDKSQQFNGTYSVENNLLIPQPGNGEAMVGRVVPNAGRGFQFFLVGGPPSDPGLTFTS